MVDVCDSWKTRLRTVKTIKWKLNIFHESCEEKQMQIFCEAIRRICYHLVWCVTSCMNIKIYDDLRVVFWASKRNESHLVKPWEESGERASYG